MRPQNSLTREPYIYKHDDGSTRGVVFVAVEGLPGLYPEEPSLTGVAKVAQQYMQALREDHGDHALDDHAIEEVVAAINDEKRITNVEAAWQAAQYEDVIRTALPAARVALKAAEEPYNALVSRNLPSVTKIIDLFIQLQTSGNADAIREQYVDALKPEQKALFDELRKGYQQASAQLSEMVSCLHERSDQAVFDYDDDVDHAQEVQQEDRRTYVEYLP